MITRSSTQRANGPLIIVRFIIPSIVVGNLPCPLIGHLPEEVL
jgi:hypothetical protein